MPVRPSFSVIVPAFNAERTLGACLDSIHRLDPAPNQVIVVDDASSDRTAEIAEASGAQVLRSEKNVGQGVARNLGARLATSEFLAFTDADCVVSPGWLSTFESGLSEGRFCGVSGPYEASSVEEYLPQLIDRWLRFNQAASPEAVDSAVTANLAVARADFEAVGGFPEYRLPWSDRCCVTNEDEEFAHLLSRHTGKLLRWQTSGGVLHAYRPTIAGFLRQQMRYAESILISRARFPSLLRAKSHYSQRSGLAGVDEERCGGNPAGRN